MLWASVMSCLLWAAPMPGVAHTANAWQLAPGCDTLDRCVARRLDTAPITECSDANHVSLAVTNTCNEPVAVAICLQRADSEWECSRIDRLAPRAHQQAQLCGASGVYKLLATRSATPSRALACFKDAAPTADAAGACMAAQACCNALTEFHGLESMAAACSALGQADDPNGSMACAQVLAFMKQSALQLPNLPTACQ